MNVSCVLCQRLMAQNEKIKKKWKNENEKMLHVFIAKDAI